MKITDTKLEGVKRIEPVVHQDHRGFFMESFNDQNLQECGIAHRFIQDNHSMSREAGIIRGLHYQLSPKGQTKLIRVVSGAIYDVVVDIRVGSPTYGQWQSFILSADNYHQLLVPKGFAHGFCTLVPDTEVIYKVDAYYSAEHDRGIAWNDPDLNIDWPVYHPVLSDKDSKHPFLASAENNFIYEG
ncbi:dTDP-4-dehydrorhamnose 3,5-epimerase [Bacillus sp. FJAT-18019]|uniref:dTDP-4-dehydrorhamnose 3,5-epimerase n=1 Tax=Paenibacillus solani TaxID=1705565 RepID=A0A0M1P107_9BACL|nr:dTDP-4-dehydrorhamnose 3,5-epimerase [Paenibacillus solani]KOP64511.1 dTDP-4-dehydrorhamnose 3,5-epimerase [Bacillus sp. FJAT-18019]KOR88146.1 dTDP-4-dehydrorhamnose 3,5-epimerase [Paenibacillus solani]